MSRDSTMSHSTAELVERLQSRVKIETACGNRTENPNNHVRLMAEAADRLQHQDRLREALTDARDFIRANKIVTGSIGKSICEKIDRALTQSDNSSG